MVAPIIAAGARVLGSSAGRKRLAGAAAQLPGRRAKVEHRISGLTAAFMVALALIIDVLQFFITFIPIFGPAINIYAAFLAVSIFGLWFYLLGVSYMSGRKAGVKIVSAMTGVVAELVPIVSALPALTISVIFLVWASRLEDSAHLPAQAGGATNSPRFMPQKIPLPQAANDIGPAQ